MNEPLTLDQTAVESRSFIHRVYGWMCLGLAITGWLAAVIGTNEAFLSFVLQNRILFYGLIIGEFGLVIALSGWIQKMTVGAATLAFVAYAAFTGVTLSTIFAVYTAGSIASTFFVTSGTFGVMSLYGYVTKTDLSSIGNFLFMALIGIILASVVNIFLHSSALYWGITYIGILIFVGLTAYDTQKIKRMAASGDMENEEGKKLAILGALALYLDFINLFLMMLRVMGRRD